MSSLRQCGVGCSIVLSVSVISIPMSHAELVQLDRAWPSVGPGSDGSLAEPQWVNVDVGDAGDTGEAAVQPRPSADSTESNTPAVALGFDGVDGTFKGAPDCCIYKPPDTHMAVGPGAGAAGRVVEVTNSGIQLWDKNGVSLAGLWGRQHRRGSTGAGQHRRGTGGAGPGTSAIGH